MTWASTACPGLPLTSSAVAAGKRALRPVRSPRTCSPLPAGGRIGRQYAAARIGGRREHEHVHEKLHADSSPTIPRQIPDQRGLAVLEETARGLFRVAKTDLGAGRTGGAKG